MSSRLYGVKSVCFDSDPLTVSCLFTKTFDDSHYHEIVVACMKYNEKNEKKLTSTVHRPWENQPSNVEDCSSNNSSNDSH